MSTLVGLLIVPWTAMLRGLTLSILWRWFVVDAFHVAPLSIPGALGIAVIVTLLTHQVCPASSKAETPSFLAQVVVGTITSAAALFSGWIYKLFL